VRVQESVKEIILHTRLGTVLPMLPRLYIDCVRGTLLVVPNILKNLVEDAKTPTVPLPYLETYSCKYHQLA